MKRSLGVPWHIAAHAEAVMPMRETHVLLDRILLRWIVRKPRQQHLQRSNILAF